MFVLLLGLSCPGAHLFKLFFESLDLFIFLTEKCFATLDGSYLRRRELKTLFWNLLLVKGSLDILGAVTVINPIGKLKEASKRQNSILRSHNSLGMNGKIAKLINSNELAPNTLVDRLHKCTLVKQRREIIAIRHADGVINGVDPLDGKLERLSAPNRTHGGRSRKNPLGLNTGIGKEAIVAIFTLQEVEIHVRHPSHTSANNLIC